MTANQSTLAQLGLVRLCVCVLHSFSTEEKFGKALHNIFVDETNLPAVARIPSFSGTYADYLIIVSDFESYCVCMLTQLSSRSTH
jgi:hypothetical protein